MRLFACEGRLSSFSAVSKSHGVRYLSAGLNNLKSDLNTSVNYSTSVNVDLSMSLNCSFYIWGMYARAENGDLLTERRQYGFDSRILHIDIHMTGGELKKRCTGSEG